MTLTFSKPSFTKIVSPATGTAEPCYTFKITTTEPLTGLVESEESQLPVDYLTRHLLPDNEPWIHAFITDFLKSSTKYFAKPYTPETVRSRLSHAVQEKTPLPFCSQVLYTPIHLDIFQGKFTLVWSFTHESGLIAIPDETVLVASSPAVDALWVKTPRQLSTGGGAKSTGAPTVLDSEAEVEAIPLTHSSDVVALARAPNTLDKRRVQEAALRAKLALLRAERTNAEYIQKYGQEASDESEYETETETETEDSD